MHTKKPSISQDDLSKGLQLSDEQLHKFNMDTIETSSGKGFLSSVTSKYINTIRAVALSVMASGTFSAATPAFAEKKSPAQAGKTIAVTRVKAANKVSNTTLNFMLEKIKKGEVTAAKLSKTSINDFLSAFGITPSKKAKNDLYVALGGNAELGKYDNTKAYFNIFLLKELHKTINSKIEESVSAQLIENISPAQANITQSNLPQVQSVTPIQKVNLKSADSDIIELTEADIVHDDSLVTQGGVIAIGNKTFNIGQVVAYTNKNNVDGKYLIVGKSKDANPGLILKNIESNFKFAISGDRLDSVKTEEKKTLTEAILPVATTVIKTETIQNKTVSEQIQASNPKTRKSSRSAPTTTTNNSVSAIIGADGTISNTIVGKDGNLSTNVKIANLGAPVSSEDFANKSTDSKIDILPTISAEYSTKTYKVGLGAEAMKYQDKNFGILKGYVAKLFEVADQTGGIYLEFKESVLGERYQKIMGGVVTTVGSKVRLNLSAADLRKFEKIVLDGSDKEFTGHKLSVGGEVQYLSDTFITDIGASVVYSMTDNKDFGYLRTFTEENATTVKQLERYGYFQGSQVIEAGVTTSFKLWATAKLKTIFGLYKQDFNKLGTDVMGDQISTKDNSKITGFGDLTLTQRFMENKGNLDLNVHHIPEVSSSYKAEAGYYVTNGVKVIGLFEKVHNIGTGIKDSFKALFGLTVEFGEKTKTFGKLNPTVQDRMVVSLNDLKPVTGVDSDLLNGRAITNDVSTFEVDKSTGYRKNADGTLDAVIAGNGKLVTGITGAIGNPAGSEKYFFVESSGNIVFYGRTAVEYNKKFGTQSVSIGFTQADGNIFILDQTITKGSVYLKGNKILGDVPLDLATGIINKTVEQKIIDELYSKALQIDTARDMVMKLGDFADGQLKARYLNGTYSAIVMNGVKNSKFTPAQILELKAGTMTNDYAESIIKNHLPVPTFVNFVVNEDGSYSGVLTATDADNDTLTFIASTAPTNGTLSILPNGNFVYTPTPLFHGIDSFSYSVSDGKISVSMNVDITVNHINHAPVISQNIADITVLFGSAFSPVILPVGTDVDNDSLVTSVTGLPIGLLYNSLTRTISGTPSVIGTFLITYIVTDGTLSASKTFNIVLGSDTTSPVAINDVAVTPYNTTITGIDVLANDTDNSGTLILQNVLTTQIGGVFVVNAGKIDFTPTTGFTGAASCVYTVNDATGNTTTSTLNITVGADNIAPVAVNDSAITPYSTTITGIDVLANDTDNSGTKILQSALASQIGGVFSVNAGKIDFTPTTGFSGPASCIYTVKDATGNSSTATLTVTVGADNIAPVISNFALSGTHSEAAGYTQTDAINISVSASDNVGVTGWYISESSATPAASAVNQAQPTSFNLSAGNGLKTVYIWARDAVGNVSLSSTQSITLDSTAPSLPVVSGVVNGTFYNTNITPTVSNVAGVTFAATLDGSPFTLGSQISANGSHVLVITPTKTINNLAGTPLTISFTIDKALPSANSEIFATNFNTSLLGIDVLANDSDNSGTVLLGNITNPVGGAFTINSGRIDFVPTAGFSGTASCNYEVKDQAGNISLAVLSITVSINPDTTPDAYDITNLTNQTLSTVVTTNPITISGINQPVTVTTNLGTIVKNGVDTGLNSTTAVNGNTIAVRLTTSALNSTTQNGTITIGTLSDNFSVTTEAVILDTTPDQFNLISQSNVGLSTLVESAPFAVSGINTATPISIASGEYAISTNGGASYSAWSNSVGSVNNGNLIKVRQTSSSSFSTNANATLTIGGVSSIFTITTLAADITPDAFNLASQSNVAVSTTIESAPIVITGINTVSHVSISGGEYAISTNGGVSYSAWATGIANISSGNLIKVRHTSSANVGTLVNTTLTIGGVSSTFTTTTVAADTIPNAFSFTNQSGVATSALVESAPIAITGINTGTLVTITGGSYAISTDFGATYSAYTSANGIIYNGNLIKILQTTSALNGTNTDTQVSIGGVNSTFTTTTVAADTIPDNFSIVPQNGVLLSTSIESAAIQITGINAPTSVSVSAGEYAISTNGGASYSAWTSGVGVINVGNYIKVRQTSSAVKGTLSSITLNIGGVTSAFNITTVANNAPNSSTIPTEIQNEQTAFSKNFSSYFTDLDSDTLTYTATFDPALAGFSISSNGVITGTTPMVTSQSDYSVTITAKDSSNASTSQTFVIRVNNSINEAPTGNAFAFNVSGFAAQTFNWKTNSSATDVNGDTVTATIKSQGAYGISNIVGDNLTYTPDGINSGTDTVVITLSDSKGGTKDVTITLNGVTAIPNTLPTITGMGGDWSYIDGFTVISKSVTINDTAGDKQTVTITCDDGKINITTPGLTVSGNNTNSVTISNFEPGTINYEYIDLLVDNNNDFRDVITVTTKDSKNATTSNSIAYIY